MSDPLKHLPPAIRHVYRHRRHASPEYVALWDAINAYAEACGANTGFGNLSERRMNAVVWVDQAIEALVSTPPPAFRTVVLAAVDPQNGAHTLVVELPWRCIYCGGPRGEPVRRVPIGRDHGVLVDDDDNPIAIDVWDNPCGHAETHRQIHAWLAYKEG